MTSRDLELTAVCTFLNELSLDEIIQYGPGGVATRLETKSCTAPFRSDESICSVDDDNDETVCESSVAGTTSGEGSDSEDPQEHTKCPTTMSKRLRTETQREQQRAYDKKFRTNKRVSWDGYQQKVCFEVNH